MSMKELKSVDIASFTTISTGIATLFALLISIILDAILLILVPGSLPVVILLTTTIVFGTLVSSVFLYFAEGYLYNVLSKQIKCISLGIDESGCIKKISPEGTALIIGAITFSILVVLYLASILLLPSLLSTIASILYYSGQQLLFSIVYSLLFIVSNPLTVLVGIIIITIMISLIILISVYIYNLLANSNRGIIVNLSKEENYFVLDKIQYENFAISIAAISLILNILLGVIRIVYGSPIFSTLTNVLITFIITLIEALVLAAFYNFLAPRIGKLKFELEN